MDGAGGGRDGGRGHAVCGVAGRHGGAGEGDGHTGEGSGGSVWDGVRDDGATIPRRGQPQPVDVAGRGEHSGAKQCGDRGYPGRVCRNVGPRRCRDVQL